MLSFLASALLPIVGVVAERSYTLNVVDGNVNPDGFVRSAVTVDGSFAPLLTANRYDDLQVTVNNQLADEALLRGTSIVSEMILSRTYWYPTTFGLKALAWNVPT